MTTDPDSHRGLLDRQERSARFLAATVQCDADRRAATTAQARRLVAEHLTIPQPVRRGPHA